MTTKQQWAVMGVAVAVLGLALWFATVRLGNELFPLKIGSRAPEYTAVTLPPRASSTGATVAAGITKGPEDYAGEVVLLNIWATWCGPCRVEMPSIQRLQDSLASKGLRIVAVSVDDPGMEQAINNFADEYKLSFEILHDASARIRQQYQTTGVPETFIVDRTGVIRRRIIGAENWATEANIAFLERLLAEPKP